MAEFLAVANRKGGVGKSTISVMLTHAFAVWGGKRVLLLDLDSQCNASLILQGGEGWVSARKAHKTIADYFLDTFDESAGAPRDYLVHNVGDVRDGNGRKPVISLLPGSMARKVDRRASRNPMLQGSARWSAPPLRPSSRRISLAQSSAPLRIQLACRRSRSRASISTLRHCCQRAVAASVATSATVIIANSRAAPR